MSNACPSLHWPCEQPYFHDISPYFLNRNQMKPKKTYILGNPLEVVLVLPSSSANPVDMNITRSKPKSNHFSPRSGVIISINDVRGAWNFQFTGCNSARFLRVFPTF